MKRSNINYVNYCLGVVLLLLSSIIYGCESEYSTPSNTNALVFSTDTLSFDTLFVGDRSETYALKLYNKSDKNVLIDQILLEGGELSHYNVNIDGNNVSSLSSVELAAKDSLYIFVNILCPDISDAFCSISDKITLRVGSLTKSSVITTYIQNFNLLDNAVINHNTTLNSTLPYRVVGELKVNEGTTLNIAPNTRLYMAKGSRIEVFGALIAQGEIDKHIVIHGDRLTSFYDSIPAQWDHICINKSAQAYLKCVDISNAKYALQVDSTATVEVNSSSLRDASKNLIYSRFGNISILNSLFCNCGAAVIEDQASNIDIVHSTFSNHFTWDYRKKPSLNLLPYGDNTYGDILIANSVIEGNLDEELVCESESMVVDHSAISIKNESKLDKDSRFTNVISMRKINFVNRKGHDYHIKPTSEGIEKGNSKYVSLCPIDFEGNERDTSTPTIGAYECPQQDNNDEK
ncbi:MAG: hypothetical protein MJZ31_01240 [Bacteroidales bacterium]|nr:hypothetical protein [Bacteroidales bacterium]